MKNNHITYKKLPSYFFSEVDPQHVESPQFLVYNNELAEELNFYTQQSIRPECLLGLETINGEKPIAQAYAGHQFGHFTMLGDGRAALIYEGVDKVGNRYDIHLKGFGPTPYSRGGDGKAAVGPMLREYLISEALHYLGIPTTRSLAVIETGQDVYRHAKLKGAVLARVAQSHIRVGTFQLAAAKGDLQGLKALADYSIERHYPQLINTENPYVSFFKSVVEKQAYLIAQWQLIGFVHGVMNTDNMTISGETIDYGPCAFMDTYDPQTVFSSIDLYGRYAYKQQPQIGYWNLSQLGYALAPLMGKSQLEAGNCIEETLKHYWFTYHKVWFRGMLSKLGLKKEEDGDKELIKDWLFLLEKHEVDYTLAHLNLTYDRLEHLTFAAEKNWYNRWKNRILEDDSSMYETKTLMKANNPVMIPRNHKVEEALVDMNQLNEMIKCLKNPYDINFIPEAFQMPAPKKFGKYVTTCGT